MTFDPGLIVSAPRAQTLSEVAEGALPMVLAQLARCAAPSRRVIYVAPDDAAASIVDETAPFFAPELETIMVPAWDCLPYDRSSPSLRISAERIAALGRLATSATEKPPLVITTINALLQKVAPPAQLRELLLTIRTGQKIDRDQLIQVLGRCGYQRSDTVTDAGEYAVRGGLVDVYPPSYDEAMRLDFFGDEIDSIRRFNPADQRTIGKVDSFQLSPVSEVQLDEAAVSRFRKGYIDRFGALATSDPLYQSVSEGRRFAGMEHWLALFVPALGSLAGYFSQDDLLVLHPHVRDAARERLDAIADYHDARRTALAEGHGSYQPLKPDELYLSADELDSLLNQPTVRQTTPFSTGDADSIPLGLKAARDFAPERTNDAGGVYDALKTHLEALGKQGRRRIIACYTVGARDRLAGLLADHEVTDIALAETWQEALAGGRSGIALLVLAAEHGFASDELELLTEQDILGDRLVRRRKRSARKADAFLRELSTLSPGEIVVHSDHGIGRFEGLVTLDVGGAPHDCVHLVYHGGDKLYVPVENIDVLSRFGSESEGVTLDKLGGAAWQSRKARMKERIREIAHELLKTAAARSLKSAPASQPSASAMAEFCARFPYVETEDQARAADEVLADLAAGRPMDRLVCGDVGFGKTEVALRAAFATAMDGHQVALVCPTTLLARQHYENFKARFAGFPLEVCQLSRLVSSTQAAEVKSGLADGTVDIVIGTHALLGKAISFKRLALVIVDEEQHFGVVHKERLKQLRANVHVLTLTATPIPRTLQMALSGLRDLSLITTPPVDRLAVRTYVTQWDDVVMREALLREHYRGGQSFIVAPRIKDLAAIEQFLRDKVPEIKPVTAHGQMAAGEIEDRMSGFVDKRYDVLLSTSIIESGLDIPSANTLIVHCAEMFGLAQLYQLRGRVGRSKTRAYAYLTTPANRMITEAAEKRLKVLSSLDNLGAGFQLASHDLDQRGAGNLLGDEQSGHIKEVGFELYQQMLEDAILATRAETQGIAVKDDDFSPQITLGASVLIPEDYVPDLALRMALYRRIGDIENRGAIEEIAAEMIDRFGPLPAETKALLRVVEIKAFCRVAGIARLEAGARGAVVSFHGNSFSNPAGLVEYLSTSSGTAKLRPDQKLVFTRDWSDARLRQKGALQIVRALARIAGAGEVAAPARKAG